MSGIYNPVHAKIVRKKRHAGYYTSTNREMDEVLTQLNRASPTILRLCEEQGSNADDIINDSISKRAGITKMSAKEIAEHDAEIRERSVAAGKIGGERTMKKKGNIETDDGCSGF